MPAWKQLYKTRRATRILSHSVRLLHSALELMGEPVYLLKRMARANAPVVQKNNRRVSTLTKTISSYSTDPDTGNLRGLVWDERINTSAEYPDQGVFTATVSTSGETSIYDLSVDKYSFISSREEYAFDEFRDEVDGSGDPLPHQVYIVFNTPPFHVTNSTICTFGYANPLTSFTGMQPIRDNQDEFRLSVFGFDQWLSATTRIRRRVTPNAFLLCFPSINSDFQLSDSGFLQASNIRHWANPPPYGPALSEFDVIVRRSTGQRYQIINFTKIFIEDIFVQQQFDMVELDPRSQIYNITVVTT